MVRFKVKFVVLHVALLTACGSVRQPIYQAPPLEGNASIEFSQSGMYLFHLSSLPTRRWPSWVSASKQIFKT